MKQREREHREQLNRREAVKVDGGAAGRHLWKPHICKQLVDHPRLYLVENLLEHGIAVLVYKQRH